jgi:hypothetical protein
MEAYFIQGIILPERAPLTYEYGLKFKHVASDQQCIAKVSILLNQVAVWLDVEKPLFTIDIKNIVTYLVLDVVNAVCYLTGYVYDFQVTRIFSRYGGIDEVVGIDNPVISKRQEFSVEKLDKIKAFLQGDSGVYINRCLSDLTAAMRYREDPAFYCYRAIESLRKHYAFSHGLWNEDKTRQWECFRDSNGFSRAQIDFVRKHATETRHGGVSTLSADEYTELLNTTWNIVDTYLKL